MDYKYVIENIGTPTYVFDINKLDERIEFLKSKLDKKFDLVYAVKANTFIAKEIEEKVSRYEICSKGEFDICNNLGVSHQKMVISGVNKDRESIEEMISNYDDILKYTVESVNQYHLLKELSTKYNRKINLLLILTSGNQFGITDEELKSIIKNNDSDLITISGIEYFSGTQKSSIKKVNKEVDKLLELVSDIEENLGFNIEEIEYGPGIPIFYFRDDEFDEEEYFSGLNDALLRLGDKHVSLEIGRGIAATCGYYFTSVADMKTNKNGNYAILDGGINQLVYYGQTMAMRIPYYDLYPQREKNEEIYNLYGSLCTVNDIIVKNIGVNGLELGDTFIFKNVGAYSMTEGISLFLSRDLPKVVLYNRNKEYKVVRDVVKTSSINCPKY